jgi:hypothetical protein
VVVSLVAYSLQFSRHAAKHPLYSILAACKVQVALSSTTRTCSTTLYNTIRCLTKPHHPVLLVDTVLQVGASAEHGVHQPCHAAEEPRHGWPG